MLNHLRYKINLYRRYPYWYRLNCIFIHIPKAAGTSINKALYGRTLGHYSGAEIKKKFPGLYKKAFTFSVTRNPWDRVLSAYRFARVGRTDSMGVRDPNQYRIPEFETFERFVCDWLPKQNIEELDFIFRPQSMFVCDGMGRVMVDHLGQVEAIGETVKILSERLGRKVVISNENSTGTLLKSYCASYNRPEMVEIVRSVYRQDVDFFGYEFE